MIPRTSTTRCSTTSKGGRAGAPGRFGAGGAGNPRPGAVDPQGLALQPWRAARAALADPGLRQPAAGYQRHGHGGHRGCHNGAPDHYEWALLGKREMLVPYNSYAVHQKGLALATSSRAASSIPDLLRYELHRVWWSRRPCARASAIPTPSAASTSTKTAGRSSPPTSTTRMACGPGPGGPSDQLLRCAAGLQHPGSDLRLQGRPLLRRWAGQQRADVRLRRTGRAARLHPQALRREGN